MTYIGHLWVVKWDRKLINMPWNRQKSGILTGLVILLRTISAPCTVSSWRTLYPRRFKNSLYCSIDQTAHSFHHIVIYFSIFRMMRVLFTIIASLRPKNETMATNVKGEDKNYFLFCKINSNNITYLLKNIIVLVHFETTYIKDLSHFETKYIKDISQLCVSFFQLGLTTKLTFKIFFQCFEFLCSSCICELMYPSQNES